MFGHFLLPYLPFTYLLWFQFCVFMVVCERMYVCTYVCVSHAFSFFPVCLHHFILVCFLLACFVLRRIKVVVKDHGWKI